MFKFYTKMDAVVVDKILHDHVFNLTLSIYLCTLSV